MTYEEICGTTYWPFINNFLLKFNDQMDFQINVATIFPDRIRNDWITTSIIHFIVYVTCAKWSRNIIDYPNWYYWKRKTRRSLLANVYTMLLLAEVDAASAALTNYPQTWKVMLFVKYIIFDCFQTFHRLSISNWLSRD